MLNEMKNRISVMESSQRKSFLRSNTLPEKQVAHLSSKQVFDVGLKLSKDTNPFEVAEDPQVEIPDTQEEVVSRPLDTSLLRHIVEGDIAEEEVEELTKQKLQMEQQMQEAKDRELSTKLQKEQLEIELKAMEQARAQEEIRIAKEAKDLEDLRLLKEKLQREHEYRVKLQQDIDREVEEELIRHKMAKEQIDQHILSTNLPASDYDTDNLNKEPTFKQDESSILSPNKSSADEYSSFMNDIRTVYELQEEESKLDASQADIQTVIQKPTPTPCLEDSEITVFDNELVDLHSN